MSRLEQKLPIQVIEINVTNEYVLKLKSKMSGFASEVNQHRVICGEERGVCKT